MNSSTPPTKHHYIPAFYLKRWKGSDGKINEYTKPYRDIVVKDVMPERTGYQERLYELNGYEPEIAQQVEEKFFKPLDTWASDALKMLEDVSQETPWTTHSRSAWTRFILSLMLRCPEDIAALREWWQIDFGQTDDAAEAQYRAVRTNGDPETFAEFLEGQPLSLKERYQYKILFSLIDHEIIGHEMNRMHWRVLPTPTEAPTLLTSDRPVIRTKNIHGPQGHIVLPIGPRLLFFASPNAQFLKQLLRADPTKITKEVNRQVVEGASRFVYGVDTNHLRFVQNRFGKTPQPRTMENILARGAA